MTNENSKIVAVLAYLLVGIIWYFVDEKMKKDAFAKFHVQQGIVLLIASVAVMIANSILMFIPFLGWLAVVALQIGIFVLWVIGIINALNNKQSHLPIIGKYGDKLKI